MIPEGPPRPTENGIYFQRMKTGFVLAVAAYTAVLWAAGLRLHRRPEGLDSFFLASRGLGSLRVAFSLCASWIGAASLLVSTDEAFRDGFSAIWIIGIPAVATLLILLALVVPVRAAAGSTLSDLMESKYGKAARFLTSALIVWYMTVLAASQMVAAGSFLGVFLGISTIPSLAIAAGIVLVYSATGGLPSVSRTHVVQVILLVAGVTGMIAALTSRTSWAAVHSAAGELGKGSYFDMFAHADRNILVALSFVLAWTISPIAWQRMQAARSEGAARRGLLGAALLLAVFYVAIVAAGMLFLPLFPGGAGGVPLVTAFVSGESGSFLGGLLFVTVLAAILSTMDAALNAGAFTLAKDLLGRGKGPRATPRAVALARASTVALALAAFLVATQFHDILKTLGLASKVMAEGLLIPGLAALFLKKKRPWAGLLSLAFGGGYAVVCFLEEAGLRLISIPAWPGSLPLGVGLGAAGFLAGLFVERVRERGRAGSA
jgi:solute:Na+ symporter, SSS family